MKLFKFILGCIKNGGEMLFCMWIGIGVMANILTFGTLIPLGIFNAYSQGDTLAAIMAGVLFMPGWLFCAGLIAYEVVSRYKAFNENPIGPSRGVKG